MVGGGMVGSSRHTWDTAPRCHVNAAAASMQRLWLPLARHMRWKDVLPAAHPGDLPGYAKLLRSRALLRRLLLLANISGTKAAAAAAAVSATASSADSSAAAAAAVSATASSAITSTSSAAPVAAAFAATAAVTVTLGPAAISLAAAAAAVAPAASPTAAVDPAAVAATAVGPATLAAAAASSAVTLAAAVGADALAAASVPADASVMAAHRPGAPLHDRRPRVPRAAGWPSRRRLRAVRRGQARGRALVHVRHRQRRRLVLRFGLRRVQRLRREDCPEQQGPAEWFDTHRSSQPPQKSRAAMCAQPLTKRFLAGSLCSW